MDQDVSLATAKASLSELTRTAEEQHIRFHITKHGRRSSAIIAEADLRSLLDTIEELSDAESIHAIQEALADGWSEEDILTREQADALIPGGE
ncbi:MAG: type II toxin-antitoxin system Phd/YefM family antitoxin [Actinobacteria bacterium]|nr:type II toxin-antitoxin system Phd/YefM family antitoxin [Actinomycetota bacterium]